MGVANVWNTRIIGHQSSPLGGWAMWLLRCPSVQACGAGVVTPWFAPVRSIDAVGHGVTVSPPIPHSHVARAALQPYSQLVRCSRWGAMLLHSDCCSCLFAGARCRRILFEVRA